MKGVGVKRSVDGTGRGKGTRKCIRTLFPPRLVKWWLGGGPDSKIKQVARHRFFDLENASPS